jgi:hypothetical protein
MFEQRDDTLPRAGVILSHFRRNLEAEMLNIVRDEFKNQWSSPIQIKNPLDFKVEIWFDRVIPEDILKSIHSELAEHGWKNYLLDLKAKEVGGTMHHYLLVKLDHAEACKYA